MNEGQAERETPAMASWPRVDVCFNAGLSATKSEKGRASLQHVREAVGELRRKSVKITVDAVGSLCVELHGGPLAQSIRNSDRAMAVVKSAIGAQAAESAPPTRGKPKEVQVLEQIPDPASRAMAEGWFAERRALWDENCKLRAAARLTQAIAFVSDEMLKTGVDRLEQIVALVKSAREGDGGLSFDDKERSACRQFLEVGLASAGLAVDEPSGEIINTVSRTIAHQGVASALRKIVEVDGQ